MLVAGGCRQFLGLDEPAVAPHDAATTDTRPLDARGDAPWSCPNEYVAVGTSHYRFVETRARGLDAIAACVSDQTVGPPFTHLVVISGEDERQALLPLRSPTNDAYWIGLTDIRGDWQWVTAEPINGYPGASGPPWSANQPMSGANCAVLVGPNNGVGENGFFNSDFCKPPATVSLPYICECDGYPDDPMRH